MLHRRGDRARGLLLPACAAVSLLTGVAADAHAQSNGSPAPSGTGTYRLIDASRSGAVLTGRFRLDGDLSDALARPAFGASDDLPGRPGAPFGSSWPGGDPFPVDDDGPSGVPFPPEEPDDEPPAAPWPRPSPRPEPLPDDPDDPPPEPAPRPPIACPTCLGGPGTVDIEGGVLTTGGLAKIQFSLDNNGEEIADPFGVLNNGDPIPDDEEPARSRVPNSGKPVDTTAGAAGQVTDDVFADVVLVSGGTEAHCSGIAIAPRHVLTARHCVPAATVQVANRADRVARQARVTTTYSHPDADAAVLVVDADLVDRARERRPRDDRRPPVGLVRLVGFGVNDFVRFTGFGVKRRLDVPVTGWGCDARVAGNTGCDPQREMVVPRTLGRDTCAGDSGGPVFEPHRGGWRLLAITSRSVAGTHARCGHGGVYVRVNEIEDWLTQVLAGTREEDGR